MQKKGYIVDYIFRVLTIIVLVLGFFPFSNEIHFYPKGSGEIISLSCKTDNYRPLNTSERLNFL